MSYLLFSPADISYRHSSFGLKRFFMQKSQNTATAERPVLITESQQKNGLKLNFSNCNDDFVIEFMSSCMILKQ